MCSGGKREYLVIYCMMGAGGAQEQEVDGV
jgi:hypothetical protein